MTSAPRAAILGLEGLTPSDEEKRFFKESDPWGFILFARNIETPNQVARLTAALRDSVGRDAPVLIDQEGGRVARLRDPYWQVYPPARVFGRLYADDEEKGLEACRLGARLIARDLGEIGVDVDCLPVLDVPQPGAHDVIGDRAYGETAAVVSALGLAAAEGLLEEGVLPVIKHIPGHGRAMVDSHEHLPTVEAEAESLRAIDFQPFKALCHMPLAMTAHVLYSSVDAEAPATTSPTLIGLIREEIGFDGLLMTDDLSMRALGGSFEDRAKASLAAGCDMLLHCNGDMGEMTEVMSQAPRLKGKAAERAKAALAKRGAVSGDEKAALRRRFEALVTPYLA